MTAGLLEIGEVTLAASQARLETVSRNVANATTPGYRRALSYSALSASGENMIASVTTDTDHAQGALRETGRTLDLAISGAGFFQLRSEHGVYYSRNGQFERLSDGRLANGQGHILQSADGADFVISSGAVEILADGAVLQEGVPIARIGLFEPVAETSLESVGGMLFRAAQGSMTEVPTPHIRQGMLESANVDAAGEMMAMMSAIRQAEIGARIIQSYDSLMGQSISTFGRTQR